MRQRVTCTSAARLISYAPIQQTMVPQACSFVFPVGGLVDPLLRASNEALATSYTFPWKEWPRLPFTARIERAHSYRARSASKKGTWPLPLILPLQRAEEGVPREAQEREAARFLSPDCEGLHRSNDLHRCIALNSSNRRNLPFFLLAHNPLNLHDGAAMPAIDSRIVRRNLPIQPADFRPPCFIAKPGSFLPL